MITTMRLMAETYYELADKALEDFREEVGKSKIKYKKMNIVTK